MTVLQQLDQFTRFAKAKLREDERELSLEECLQLWRRQIEEDETIADIKQGLADIEAGRVKPLKEAVDDVRRQLGISQ